MTASTWTPFVDIPAWAIACVAVSQFAGFCIRGAFGFGSNLVIVLATTWLLGPHHAILLALLTAAVAQIHLLPQGLHTADWDVVRPLVAGMLIGTAAGVLIFKALAPEWLTLVMATLILGILLLDRFEVLPRLARRVNLRSRALNTALAVFSGGVGTVSGGGGIYFLVVYLKLACRGPSALRGTNLVLSAGSQLARLTMFVTAGVFTGGMVSEALLLLPAVFLGTWAGTRFYRASSPERFYRGIQLVLVTGAIALLAKGIARLA